jgi:DNA-binding NtrC family response regulator
VPRNILPQEGAPGTAKMKVFWDLVLAGQEEQVYHVGFSVKNYRKCLKTLEQQVLTRALKLANGNKAEVARLLQADYKTIHNKLKKLAIVGENHDK